MQNAPLTITCPNMKCRAANPEEQTFCHNCKTRIPKRYLWVVNFSEQEFAAGDTLSDRYVFRGPQVVLDMKPGLIVKTEVEIPEPLLPYLRLFPHRIHYSQFYTLVWVGEEEQLPIMLLEDAPLCPTDLSQTLIATDEKHPRLMAPVTPALPLKQAWSQAKPMRQLNWLWQIARLWEPFQAQKVTSSLLMQDLLRVEGRLFRVLELREDHPEADPPTLVQLGQLWSHWLQATPGPLRGILGQICEELTTGQLAQPAQLIARLEMAMQKFQQDQYCTVALATRTDKGMVREHNEDQCFPANGTYVQQSQDRLAIVCDGVGGHAGGEVASATAIAALHEHISKLDLGTLSPEEIRAQLSAACCHANDLISQRNDQEQRQDRQRMGTTLIMALEHDQQLYLVHVGDSRAYLITKLGCYQMTVDDDIASREVRLGYLPYREALRQPTAGSLVQALGMASSSILHPTVQRFVLDEDCIVLLCSDGLSDYDRVEEIWQEELLPLLYRSQELSSVSQRLIELANQLNGHDNVTVALMQIGFSTGAATAQKTVQQAIPAAPSGPPTVPRPSNKRTEEEAWLPTEGQPPSTQRHQAKSAKRSPAFLFGGGALVLALLALLAWSGASFLKQVRGGSPSPSPLESGRTSPSSPAAPGTNQGAQTSSLPEFRSRQLYEVIDERGLKIFKSTDSEATADWAELPRGSILLVEDSKIENQGQPQEVRWHQVKWCNRPTGNVAQPTVPPINSETQPAVESTAEQLPDISISLSTDQTGSSLPTPAHRWVTETSMGDRTERFSDTSRDPNNRGQCPAQRAGAAPPSSAESTLTPDRSLQ
ncbi:protein phosphatase 2C domain-containing protein [Lyngbya confervoides]|uniref:Protein phosphatase 2C domain-containing protein n=1 Tax=Lyngbya confervoides BDU141951 TaxID=1574623 RepID=A0ABD4T591_9CYAN|nr:protein phosphatase 2C domain-containing protein [Lyngbya confervoides]MCM1983412.1 protein phosphatase 2C domain-containing protein [Lyngbya confervoides BDU141951]